MKDRGIAFHRQKVDRVSAAKISELSADSSIEEREPIAEQEVSSARLLLQQIDRLLVQSERWVWIHAISTWLASALIALGVLIACDILFRWQDPGMRWLCCLTWCLFTAGSGGWWLRRAWRFAAPDKAHRRERIGLQIERHFPAARHEIASAVTFAQQVEMQSVERRPELAHSPGSSKLKFESIRRCRKLLSELPIDQCLDRRQPLVQLALFLLVVFSCLLALSFAPSTFSIATQRLLTPWQALNWPQRNQLQFVDLPEVIAARKDLELRVIDTNSRLPSRVQLEVQWPASPAAGERTRTEILDMNMVADAAQLSLPGSSLSPDGSVNKLRIRATGGDDQTMPWQEIQIADVPQLKSFAIRIDPPAHTGQASTEVASQSVRVLSGSRIFIRGDWTLPVQSASIDRWNILKSTASNAMDVESTKSGETRNDPAELAKLDLQNEGSSFSLGSNRPGFPLAIGSSSSEGIPIYQSTELAIRWKSVDGIEILGPTWTIQTIPDRIPTIELVKPVDEQPVTPGAMVPLEANVSDDLGLQSISLYWKLIGNIGIEAGKDAEHEWLWQRSDSVLSSPNISMTLNQKVERDWNIPETSSSQGITGIAVWIEAKDNADQIAQSKAITLRFTTPEQTLSELAQRQDDVRNKIEQALQQQREAALPVTNGIEQIKQNEKLLQPDLDALQSAARNQKSLRMALTQDRNSVKESLESIAEQLTANNLNASELYQENKALLDRLTELEAADLSTAQQAVTRASQLANDLARADSAADSKQNLLEQLNQSSVSQSKVMDDLQKMLDSLSRNESLRQSQRELMDVARKQRELTQRTEQLQRSTLLAPNAPELNGERTRIEVAQSELARETERIQQQLRDDSQALRESSPELAETNAKLADQLDAASLSSKMREAKESVQQSNFDNAVQQQQEVMESLSSILEQTSQSTQPTLGQLEQAISSAQQALSDIANQQQALSESIADRAENSQEKRDQQAASQAELRADTETMADQLSSWLGQNSLDDLLKAVENQQSAESALQSGEQAQAEQAAQEAANRLNRTSDMLDEMKLEIQQENIADQLQQLRPLVDRLFNEETKLADDSKASWEEVAPALKEALANREEIPADAQLLLEQASREFAARQLTLRQLLARASSSVKILPAFELVTEAILADMDQAVAGFERTQYAETALPAVEAATRRLKQLQDAIAESKPNQDPPPENEDAESPPEEDAATKAASRTPLASLKLLRSLQQDLLQETQELEKNAQTTELTVIQQSRLNRLADLQQKLAEQVESLANEMIEKQNEPQ